jgi:hypothetical protein
MGRTAVEAELGRRSGFRAELIDDIGDEPPYPTREFCEQWCAAQDNMQFRFSLRMGIILTLIFGVVASVVMANSDFAMFSAGSPSGRSGSMGGAPRMGSGAAGIFGIPPFRPGTPSRQQQLPPQPPQQRQQRQ